MTNKFLTRHNFIPINLHDKYTHWIYITYATVQVLSKMLSYSSDYAVIYYYEWRQCFIV